MGGLDILHGGVIHRSAAGFIHPRLKPWCSACGHIEKKNLIIKYCNDLLEYQLNREDLLLLLKSMNWGLSNKKTQKGARITSIVLYEDFFNRFATEADLEKLISVMTQNRSWEPSLQHLFVEKEWIKNPNVFLRHWPVEEYFDYFIAILPELDLLIEARNRIGIHQPDSLDTFLRSILSSGLLTNDDELIKVLSVSDSNNLDRAATKIRNLIAQFVLNNTGVLYQFNLSENQIKSLRNHLKISAFRFWLNRTPQRVNARLRNWLRILGSNKGDEPPPPPGGSHRCQGVMSR